MDNVREDKISFIIHKQNEIDYQCLIESLRNIEIPRGYFADVITIDGVESTAAAYNEGMRQSDAKYKVYLQENTVIINTNFLTELLQIFMHESRIGIAGFSGTKVIPTDAICIKSLHRVGKVYMGADASENNWNEIDGEYESVASLDGFLLITQYDIAWRDDLFKGNDFYDVSQCLEFKRQGYLSVVARQEKPAIYVANDMLHYDVNSRESFLDEYSYDIYPLVSIIIPTYNRPAYFKEALDSVIAQTYRNLEIFITDNSHNNDTENLMKTYLNKYENIFYEHHDEFDAADNWARARSYNNLKAEYVNWLMDDDLFMPNKISEMVNYYLMHGDVALVTSSRTLIDQDGEKIEPQDWSKPIVDQVSNLAGNSVGMQILRNMNNFIGEPTTALIKKKFLNNNNCGWSGDEGRYLISDFPTWLNAMSQGNLIYIPEPLSCFRQHTGQGQNQIQTIVNGSVCWGLEIAYAIKEKEFLTDEKIIRGTILNWLYHTGFLLLRTHNEGFYNKDVENLQTTFIKMSEALINGYHIELDFDTSL